MVDENYKFKINLLEGKEELIDGIFYVLKVRFYPRKGVNEFRLRVIEVIEKFENKLLLNQTYFKILKNKIDKGYIDIDNYLIREEYKQLLKNEVRNIIEESAELFKRKEEQQELLIEK